MALKIVWTFQAQGGLQKTLDYLEEAWTDREILKLEASLKLVLRNITLHPLMYPKSSLLPDLQKALVDKNNYLIYKVKTLDNNIEIIDFRSTRQKPLT